MSHRSYQCPNCGLRITSSKGLIRHMLHEAGPRGVTTAEFLEAGAGSRYGGRIYELRHEDGLTITEERVRDGCHRYWLAGNSPEPGTELRCALGHTWFGRCRRDARGYPMTAGAEPPCPVCARTATAVDAFIGPARPSVVARAAA